MGGFLVRGPSLGDGVSGHEGTGVDRMEARWTPGRLVLTETCVAQRNPGSRFPGLIVR